MDKQNNIPQHQPKKNQMSVPGPKFSKKILMPLAVLILLVVSYGILAKNYNWWPNEDSLTNTPNDWQTYEIPKESDQILSTVKITTANIQDANQETELIKEEQRIVIMASQYFEIEHKLPQSMTELHKWSGVTLTNEQLEFLSKNLSWKLNSNKEVEVCIVPTLQFHSEKQCQTLAQVNADLSG